MTLTLSREARAQSGLGLRLSGQVYARFALSDDVSLLPRVSGIASLYRASAFNDISGSALLGIEWRVGRDRLTPSAGPTWRWYGQQLYARTDTVAVDWVHPIGRRLQMTVSSSAAHAYYRLNPFQSGGLFDISVNMEYAPSSRSGVGGGGGVTRQTARDPGYATVAGTVNLFGWRDLGRITVFAAATARRTDDGRLFLFVGGRRGCPECRHRTFGRG